MLKKEQKKMMDKISDYVSDVFNDPYFQWTGREISQKTGIHDSRISAYKNRSKYRMDVTKDHLKSMVKNGVLDMRSVLRKSQLNSVEKAYLGGILNES